jgi:hypothetical protein
MQANNSGYFKQTRRKLMGVQQRRYLTLIEISNEYNGSTWTWRKRIRDGLMTSFKAAGEKSRILVERAEVERFLAGAMRPRKVKL